MNYYFKLLLFIESIANGVQLIYEPWEWYVVGPLMGATIPLLLFWGNKMLGASSSLRHLCKLIPNKLDYFNYDLKVGIWNMMFASGVVVGAMFTNSFLHHPDGQNIASSTQDDLSALGIQDFSGWLPLEIFGMENLMTISGFLFTLGGGFLVGFGVRYAGGCTSGHGFMGLSQLSLSSFIAIVSFFSGGMICTFFVLPYLIS